MKGSGLQFGGSTNRAGWIIAILAVLFIPFIYAALILTAKWGPYDHLSNLPVAVVNKDAGSTLGDKPVNVGKDLVAELRKSDTLGWDFVDDKKAKKGLQNTDYYMVIEIPENFSQNVTTVLDENPVKPELTYIQNEGLHYMAAQVTKSATERIRENLSNKVTASYTTALLSQMAEIENGFNDGAGGSQKINDGAGKLKSGTAQILESLQQKAPDIDKLAGGAAQLKVGTGTMYNSLAGKQADIGKLADGANQVDTGMQQVNGGARKLDAGIQKLNVGMTELNSGAQRLNGGLNDA
ncbi:YhgE/Pip domain-containing protein, partial [Bacillus sp. mrc49]|uniref:YhgE/Pip domain-containing protein n=2 Tax=Bacillus sp. mrc49 TaxID=2054913 RepID=UPI000CABA05B